MADSAIPATTPTTVTATFGFWAFTIQSTGNGLLPYGAPTGTQPPIPFLVHATKFRVRDDGCQEASPLPADTVTLAIPDLYLAAAESPAIATALGALLTAIQQYGASTGQL